MSTESVRILRVRDPLQAAAGRLTHLEQEGFAAIVQPLDDGGRRIQWCEERIVGQGSRSSVESTWHRVDYVRAPA